MTKVFGLSTCSYCKATKRYLDKNNIEYESVFVNKLEGEEREQVVDYIKKLTGGTMFPVTVSKDEEYVVGFDKKGLQDILHFEEKPRPKLF
ncbi:MAG: glutaredoxin family protein [Coriobacteriia bacterium]|nr:glutaredoxin family protein [Coriobacteriia bacterium]